ncbi:unnamed protein product [Paramecium octaurelia]|uniref:Protein kinase domain-containing protein n=1 Tax=Paramecium octaurelia TaxID=43137 RepID=A0A8S1WQL5_PAROT|nr:unnamed protein product [Paramecium octaurelia]
MQKEDDMELEFKLMELNDVEETEFDKFMLNRPLIEKHFEELNFKHFDITQNEETKQWQLTITLEQFSNKFLALCTTTINFLRKRIDCKSFIAKPDGQLIQVKEKYLQRLLARYFCRINNSLRFGCFCIENETGQIQLKLNSVMISEHWTELICLHPMQSDGQNQGSLSSLLKVLHFTSHYAIGYHIYRLMHLINKLSYKVFPFLEQKLQDQYRKIPPQFDIYLQRINEIIQNKCTTPITEDETRQFQQHFNYPKQTNSSFKIMNFIKFSNPDQVDNGDGYELIGEGGFSIVKKGQLAFTLASNSGAGKSELEDISAQTKGNQASNIKENNQTKVEVEEHSVRQIQYVPNKEQEDVQAFIKRTIVIKKDKDREKDKQNEKADKKQPSRIILEKKILDILSQPLYDNQRRLIFNGYCPYIAQFYKADTIDKNNMPLFNEHLFMEFYQHTSLDNFRSKFQTTQSLNTRLYILFQIAHALRYLSYYGVIHNDLKPGNILIAKHYNAKLTDFGEAMYKKGDQVIIQGGDGRTLPFAAPESLSEESNNSQVNQPKIDHKSDIFSFGILMYEFLFEQYPIDFKKSNLANLQERYKNKTYQIRSNIDFIKTFGPKHLMKCLRNLAIKCLHHEPQNRPNIEWIIICLKEGLMYLEKMY